MKTVTTITISIVATFFVACGGGGSDATSITSEKATITGTVPGTLIESFCKDGSYNKVNSIQNGTTKHPFSISVPKNTACSLVMTTNENNATNRVISPIKFTKNGTTGKTLSISTDINLGNVPLATSYTNVSGLDGNSDHVLDSGFELEVDGNKSEEVANTSISYYDKDQDGLVDVYQDKNSNGKVDAYDDDNNNGIVNIDEDRNSDGRPDYIEDDNGNGILNYREDSDGNGKADYSEDADGDGIENHVDSDYENGN